MKTIRTLHLVVAIGVITVPGLDAQARPDSVHLRNDCRLAVQVLTQGQPANRRDWALELIGSCGGEGAVVLGDLLRESRSVQTWDEELDRVVWATSRVIDPAILEAALQVASDASAGTVARIQSIRALEAQLSPGHLVPYRALAEPGHGAWAGIVDHGVGATWLPEDSYVRVAAAMRSIRESPDQPPSVKHAASILLESVIRSLYCDNDMTLAECAAVLEARIGS